MGREVFSNFQIKPHIVVLYRGLCTDAGTSYGRMLRKITAKTVSSKGRVVWLENSVTLTETESDAIRPSVAVIVLMWNRWEDTIECLESLYQLDYPNYHVILVDNGSHEDSIERIRDYCNGLVKTNSLFFEYDDSNKPIYIVELEREQVVKSKSSLGWCPNDEAKRNKLTIIFNRENLGFAKGNNVGVRFALNCGFDYIMLLNNDTVVPQKDFLDKIVCFMENHPDYGVCIPCIYYYDMPERVWNCGGRVLPFGEHKYFKSTGLLSSNRSFIGVSFVTGCCLTIRKDVLERFGLLSEDFFFGEEDCEFSIRMNRNKVGMACLLNAKIYHKVRRTAKGLTENRLKLAFIQHLNRLVHMKRYYPPMVWKFYKLAALTYIQLFLWGRYRIEREKRLTYV